MNSYTTHVGISGDLFVGWERWDRFEGDSLEHVSEDLTCDPWFDGTQDPNMIEVTFRGGLVNLCETGEFAFDYEECEGS